MGVSLVAMRSLTHIPGPFRSRKASVVVSVPMGPVVPLAFRARRLLPSATLTARLSHRASPQPKPWVRSSLGPFGSGSGLWAMSVEHRSFRVMTLSAPRAVMNHLVVCLVTSKILQIPEVNALRAKTAKFSTSVLRRLLFEEDFRILDSFIDVFQRTLS